MVAKKTAKKTAKASTTAPAAKAPAKTVRKKTTAAKTTAAKTAAKKTPAKKTAAKKTATRKTAVTKTAPARKTAAKAPARQPEPAAARPPDGPVRPGELMVRPGEEPWTAAEVDEVRAGLRAEAVRLRTEISQSEAAVSGLMRDSGDGAGDDQADVGTKNISREHEMSLADNAREMLRQTERALGRLDDGTYGRCESCGRPIGKARTQAFPRATLCVECKQRTERR